MDRTESPRAYVETYGCQMNIADGELMEGILGDAGYDIARSPEEADVILVNTCAIREHAETRVLGRVGQLNYFKRLRPEVVLGVTGCMAQRMKDALLDKAPYVDLVVGPDEYRGLATALDDIRAAHGPGKPRRQLSMVDLRIDEDYRGLEQRRHSAVTAWVPIQRGCDHRCTFCIVPYVRGPEKNRDPVEILDEIQGIAGGGVTEVTLLGQTVNSYRYGDWDFPWLLRSVSRIRGIQRVRFTSPHPNDVTPELIEVMAEEDGACEQIHLPVQSGSNRVLRRMLRRHTIEQYLATVRRLRDRVEGIAISTDIIAGFPGETDEDFEGDAHAGAQGRVRRGLHLPLQSARGNTRHAPATASVRPGRRRAGAAGAADPGDPHHPGRCQRAGRGQGGGAAGGEDGQGRRDDHGANPPQQGRGGARRRE